MTDQADLWFGGRLRLRQPERGGHRAGTDAVLLAHLLRPDPGATIFDLGAGTGAVGLAVALLHPECRVVLVERDSGLTGLARENVENNGMTGRVRVVEADILSPGRERHSAGLTPGMADLVLTNPPFFDEARHRNSPHPGKRDAHSFGKGDLDGWVRTCADVLAADGRLGLVHRADALGQCLDALGNRFGAIAVRPVHARDDRPAIRILATARKGSRAPMMLLPPLVLQDAEGRFTPAVEAMHRGEA
ncbi:MAG: methyltransferase [Methylobacterium sp.]|uniref:tRNA1(Val) (adenine(37)-N6)-methyltransferase n=1 Tax=Methylobacterium sp. TaxID=409 RepID=UPI0026015D23|nr:methyltransferase [Methylobacterium sp.]MBX9930756.1 methyltransferase [Methylobacterium sp.]